MLYLSIKSGLEKLPKCLKVNLKRSSKPAWLLVSNRSQSYVCLSQTREEASICLFTEPRMCVFSN